MRFLGKRDINAKARRIAALRGPEAYQRELAVALPDPGTPDAGTPDSGTPDSGTFGAGTFAADTVASTWSSSASGKLRRPASRSR
ncbi:MAG: hypothetical protein EOR03_14225 [Mesorhizobium sp.]|nr:MAG: hypothetical protein EOR03_14225 [Mesorhizobium sp.]